MYPIQATKWQEEVGTEYERLGYKVTLEWPCRYFDANGKDKSGYVDIVAIKGDEKLAIELDSASPRQNQCARHSFCTQIAVRLLASTISGRLCVF